LSKPVFNQAGLDFEFGRIQKKKEGKSHSIKVVAIAGSLVGDRGIRPGRGITARPTRNL